MKQVFLILSFVLLFTSCKKDENEPATPNTTPEQIIPKPKSMRYIAFSQGGTNQGQVNYIYNLTYAYNNLNQIVSVDILDSSNNFQNWTVSHGVQTITYTNFNKIQQVNYSSSFGSYSYFYLYNNTQKLIKTAQSEVQDTTYFTYSGNLITSEQNSNGFTMKSYYSENIDSAVVVNNLTDSVTWKTVYKRNSITDFSKSYLNQFYGIVSDKHELITTTIIDYNSSSTITENVTRVYNAKGWPIEEKLNRNGILQSITYYTYH